MIERDSIYAEPQSELDRFSFDAKVARVFPDMIRRSVPGYSTVIAMTGVLAAQYAQPDSLCYDLGCSLGASTFSMQQGIEAENCCIIAVDNSADMLAQCQVNLQQSDSQVPVELVCDDLLNVKIHDASVVVMNYTLQFVDKERRAGLLCSIYDNLLPGGVLLLSEKIHFADAQMDQRMIEMHHEFKRANGYSDLEISQKRTALENVLQPETLQQHEQRLLACGFKQIDVWFQCFNFISLIAYK
ncbi:MAG: carboxy-S-adenosyl-L-methionine synthase CmoA [Chromatiales bacterium]|jgi:tRNA (cmo5U34)-methyltransferase